jgi:hypothetical protein
MGCILYRLDDAQGLDAPWAVPVEASHVFTKVKHISNSPSDATACSEFLSALRRIHARGQTRLSANCLADEMWPHARHDNANGQMFNLASGTAGRMLRRNRGCVEVRNRVWEIVPEFLQNVKSPSVGTTEK